MLARALLGVGVVALGIGAWLSSARFASHDGLPRLSVAWIDVSASVRRTRPAADAHATRVALELARRAASAGDDFALVTVARDVTVRFAPGPAADAERTLATGGVDFARAARSADGGDGATALAAAADAVARFFERRPGGELVLVSDGRSTDGDVASALAALARSGVAITFAPLAPDALFDAALVRLAASDSVEPGAELVVRAELELSGPFGRPEDRAPDSTVLAVRVDDAEGSHVVRRRVPFADAAPSPDGGRSSLAVAVACGPARPGAIRLAAWLEPATPDAIPENEWAETSLECGDALRVLVVGDAAWLGAALAAPELAGLAFERCAPERVAERLGSAELLLADDIDVRRLPAALVDFVRFGGGLVVVPGDRALASWRARGPVQTLLPLELERDDPRPRGVVVLLDASGSMSGESDRAARKAAIELAGLAAEDERVSVRFFTDTLGPEFALDARDPATRRAEIQALLSARTPSGSTAIVGALEALADARAKLPANTSASTAERCLVFLVSDGRDEVGADEPAARRVRAALTAAGVELVVCALEPAGTTPLLDALLLPGESVAHVERADELDRVFARESSSREYVVQGPFAAVVRTAAEFSALGATEYETRVVAALPTLLAPVSRKARARVVPLAKAIVYDGAGAPLVALSRVGLGATLALGVALDSTWSESPARWREFVLAATRELARAAKLYTANRPRACFVEAALPPAGADGGAADALELELSNVPADWPVELVARLEPFGARRGLEADADPDAPERPNAPRGTSAGVRSIALAPTDGRDGADPRTVRRGVLQGSPPLADGGYTLRVLARGEPLWSGTVVHRASGEFTPRAVSWPPALPAFGDGRAGFEPTPAAVRSGELAAAQGRGPHPWAWVALASGAVLVFAGAALRLMGRG